MKLNVTFLLAFVFCFFGSFTQIQAQCGPGQTELTLQLGSDAFNSEIAWDLFNVSTGTSEAGQSFGSYTPQTLTHCVTDGDTYEFHAFDSFGDGWGNATVEISITEDGSANGCGAPQSCVVVPATEPTGGGPFGIISLGEFGCGIGCPSAPDNDMPCYAEALALDVPGGYDLLLAGIDFGEVSPGPGTIGPAPTCDAIDGWCSFETGLDNTLWYTFVAPASGCTNVITDGGDTQMAIWEVGDCGNFGSFVEVAANDDGGVGFAAALFDLELTGGATYYVQIDGYEGDAAAGSILVEEGLCPEPPENDLCDDAEEIYCGDVVSGTTVAANQDFVPFCGTSSTGPGVWYTTTGDGFFYTATTCNTANYDTKISVYEGSCGGLICVDGNDDDFACSGFTSTVTWGTTPGVDYYILVHGFGSGEGDFDLALTCVPPDPCPGDDVCDAEHLYFDTEMDIDLTFATAQVGEVNPGAGANVDNPACGTSEPTFASCNATDGWCSFELEVDNSCWFYFYAPASGCVSITTDDGGFEDTQLAVYEVGDCTDFGTFTEVGGNDDGGAGFNAALSLALTPYATYYVQVDGYEGSAFVGTILLEECPAGPVNDDCAYAIPVDCNSTVFGTNLNGCPDDDVASAGFCGTSYNGGAGVWYTYTPTGDGEATASVCDDINTDYDTKITILEGGCGAMTCVTGNDDDNSCSGFQSTAVWDATGGTTYYIYVHGFNGAEGNFALTVVSNTEPHIGDVIIQSQAELDAFFNDPCLGEIDGDIVLDGVTIVDLSPMSGLNIVTGDLVINNTGLADLTGLGNLGTIGGSLVISNNIFLGSLTDLGIEYIGASLVLSNNISLSDISALSGLTTIGTDLVINTNISLGNLSGLENVTSVGAGLVLAFNTTLTDCCAIQPLLATPGAIGGFPAIFFNASGCDNAAVILTVCAAAPFSGEGDDTNGNHDQAVITDPGQDFESFKVYPNPATTEVNVVFAPTFEDAILTLVDELGVVALKENLKDPVGTHTIKVDQLPRGIYAVVLTSATGETQQQKVILH